MLLFLRDTGSEWSHSLELVRNPTYGEQFQHKQTWCKSSNTDEKVEKNSYYLIYILGQIPVWPKYEEN